MAEHWQKWMPLYIDRFRGSPDVQAMHPAARIGYLYLLVSAWQTNSCTIPVDACDLASLSGLGDELWALHGPRILRKFNATEDGRLQNAALLTEWDKARGIFEARSKAARDTTEKRMRKQAESVTETIRHGDRTVTERPPTRSANTLTSTETTTGTKARTPARIPPIGPECSFSDADLERVYRAYPRHLGKAKALDAIRSAVLNLGTGKDWPRLTQADALKFLHEKASLYAESPSGNAGKFTPHAATWFNQARYFDDESEWQHGSDPQHAHGYGGGALASRALSAREQARAAIRGGRPANGSRDCAETTARSVRAATVLEGP